MRAQFESFFASSNEKIEKLQIQKENVEIFKNRLKEHLPDEGNKLDLAVHFRTVGEFEAQLSKARGDRRSKSIPNKREHVKPKSFIDEPVFDNLLKEINSGKVESLSRGLDPKMMHRYSPSNPRSRNISRRTISTTSNVSASSDVPMPSSAQKTAFANELKTVLKKNNNKLSESPEIEKNNLEPANPSTDTSDTDNLEVLTAKKESEPEKLPVSKTPELPPKETSKARSQKLESPSIIKNGSIPKRKELREISTQTFVPNQEEIKEDIKIPDAQQR